MAKAQTLEKLGSILQERFDAHPQRHPQLCWDEVAKRLKKRKDKLAILWEMEKTGGEPDVLEIDKATGELLFVDCSAESPEGRRSMCFDKAAFQSRKQNKPKGSAEEMALKMGVELLDEVLYRKLQSVEAFDLKTSSWIQTPAGIRALGGALFCDRRYNTVFVYHNGAESYYAARGFRAVLRV